MRVWIGFALVALLAAGCGGNVSVDGSSGGASGSGASSATGGSGAQPGTGGQPATGGTGGALSPGPCGPALETCTRPTDCVLGVSLDHRGCLCGMPELSDYTAFNAKYALQCTSAGPYCQCNSAVNPNLGVTCSAGQCTGFDVTQDDALSACTSDADCTLRNGIGCCRGCGVTAANMVAIRTDAELTLERMVCGAGGPRCGCSQYIPPSLSAACVAGHCQVVGQ